MLIIDLQSNFKALAKPPCPFMNKHCRRYNFLGLFENLSPQLKAHVALVPNFLITLGKCIDIAVKDVDNQEEGVSCKTKPQNCGQNVMENCIKVS